MVATPNALNSKSIQAKQLAATRVRRSASIPRTRPNGLALALEFKQRAVQQRAGPAVILFHGDNFRVRKTNYPLCHQIIPKGASRMPGKSTQRSHLLSIGSRIELRRRHQHLSRRVVAELVGRSEEWLRLIETDKLRLDSIRTILRLAEVLQIQDYRELIDYPLLRPHERSDNAPDVLERFAPALIDHPSTTRPTAFESQESSLPHDLIEKETQRCETVWSKSAQRYEILTAQLPHLISSCRQTYWRHRTPEIRQTLIRIYCLTSRILHRLNVSQLAAVASDRALMLAHFTDNPLHVAVSGWHWAFSLLALQQDRRCGEFALAISKTVERASPAADSIVLYGALQLLAARSLAASDPSATKRYLARLQHLAQSTDTDRTVAGIIFGEREIEMTRIEIALSYGDFDGAVNIARNLTEPQDLAFDHGARYFIALAAAFAGRHEMVAATLALVQAAEVYPEELRYNRSAHSVLRRIIEHDDCFLSAKVATLADLAGL